MGTPPWSAGPRGPGGVVVVVVGGEVVLVGAGWAVAELGVSHRLLTASRPTATASKAVTDRRHGQLPTT